MKKYLRVTPKDEAPVQKDKPEPIINNVATYQDTWRDWQTVDETQRALVADIGDVVAKARKEGKLY